MTPSQEENLASLKARADAHDVEIRDLKDDIDTILRVLQNYWPKSATAIIAVASSVAASCMTFAVIMLAMGARL